MGKTLNEIAQELKDCDKKAQIIYAFNGTGKTRLSREFKDVVQPADYEEESDRLSRDTILYYNAFTEDLFYWNNDLENDSDRKLVIQPNSFIEWIVDEQGQDQNIISHFQYYTNEKLIPTFELEEYHFVGKNGIEQKRNHVKAVNFSYQRGNNEVPEKIKISKGEESNFIWSVFYSLIENVIGILNIVEDRETDDFDDLKYIFIDDPVSSLDENHLIELAVDLGRLIKSSESNIKFIITTHNPLFYNVIHNELKSAKKYFLKKSEDGSYELKNQQDDSPFSYHLTLLEELHRAIKVGDVHKYHFNFLRNLLEKTSTFLGYKTWSDLLPEDNRKAYEARMINISSHSKYSADEMSEPNEPEKQMLQYLVEHFETDYKFHKEQS
ncbi:AAA family ATPase [Lactococcus lactis]|uniref:AAA family ATPase n=1 Tax=Lactococcus lactis TaxID=1358 RepID=UPI0039821A24